MRSLLILAAAMVLPASASQPTGWVYQVDPAICNGCGICISHCPVGAISMQGPDAVIDPELCSGCGECEPWCIRGAIYLCWWEGIEEGAEPRTLFTTAPNPTRGTAFLTGGMPGTEVSVTDISGRSVCTCTVDDGGSAAIELGGLPTGLYIVVHGESAAGAILLIRGTT